MKTSEKREIFDRLFKTGTHGCSGECACGVMHYDSCNQWDDDHQENTLPSAEASAKEMPEIYQFQSNAIEYLNFNERLYVLGCKCHMDDIVFELLHEQSEQVLTFYQQTRPRVTVDDIMS
jgi:hypothetical protein